MSARTTSVSGNRAGRLLSARTVQYDLGKSSKPIGTSPRPRSARSAPDNRTKRPWKDACTEKAESRSCLFDFYPRQPVKDEHRQVMIRLVNDLGNRQFDANKSEKTDHMQWMKEKRSAFVAAPCADGMASKWRAAGAEGHILQWIREGGYRLKVSEAGMGIFTKNGQIARQNPAGDVKLGFSKFALRDAETAFSAMDSDNNGSVDAEELQAMLSSMDVGITHEEAMLMINVLDKDGNGTLELHEVRCLLRAAQFHAGKKLSNSRPGGFEYPTEKIFDNSNEFHHLVAMRNPPLHAERVMTALLMFTQPEYATEEDCSWKAFQRWVEELGSVEAFLDNISWFDPTDVPPEVLERTRRYLRRHGLKRGAGTGNTLAKNLLQAMCDWLHEMLDAARLSARCNSGKTKDLEAGSAVEDEMALHRTPSTPGRTRKKKSSGPATYNGHQRPSVYTMHPNLPPTRKHCKVEMKDLLGPEYQHLTSTRRR